MTPQYRALQAGALFAWQFGDLADLRRRATITGNPTIADGPIGKVLRLDGTTDYLTLPGHWEDKLRFNAGTQDFSACAWVRRSALGAMHYVISKEDADNDGWRLIFTTGNTVRGSVNAVDVTSTGVVADLLWHHVAFTVDRDGNGLIYIDGVRDGTGAIGGAVMATTVAPTVGRQAYAAAGFFAGDLFSVEVYDRILTGEEIIERASLRGF